MYENLMRQCRAVPLLNALTALSASLQESNGPSRLITRAELRSTLLQEVQVRMMAESRIGFQVDGDSTLGF
jgi:hypothetical protein